MDECDSMAHHERQKMAQTGTTISQLGPNCEICYAMFVHRTRALNISII